MKTIVTLLSATALALSATAQTNPPIGTDPQPQTRGSGVLNNVLRAVTGEQDSSSSGTISLDQLTQNWNPAARQAAQAMFQKYGAPQEFTSDRLIWRNNGGWKETKVVNEDVPHHFPDQHTDVLEQRIAMNVPPEKIAELAQFSGSVIVDRTKGEIAVRCDTEANNTIALNLANDIIRGRLNAEQARNRYTELSQAVKSGQRPAYAVGFQFSVTSTNTGFTDSPSAQQQPQQQNWQRIGW
jgi:hypothetical protein